MPFLWGRNKNFTKKKKQRLALTEASFWCVECGAFVILQKRTDELMKDNKSMLDVWNTRADGWISVKDRLPEIEKTDIKHYGHMYSKSVRVLCTCQQDSGKVMVKEGYCKIWDDGIVRWQIPGSIDSVTHWKPLPEPPKGD